MEGSNPTTTAPANANPLANPAGEAATPTAQMTKEAAQEAIRRHKLKVDGMEVEVDDNELKRGYAHQTAASKRMNEGIAMQKQAREFIEMLQNEDTFFEVARKLGKDPRELAEKFLVSQIQDEIDDPRDVELRKTNKKLKQFEEMEQQRKTQAEQAEQAELQKRWGQKYSTDFVEALKETRLPATKSVVKSMASYIRKSIDIGYQMTAHEAAKLVREDRLLDQRQLFQDSDGETLVNLLGEDLANKIRKYDTSRVKSPEANMIKAPPQGKPRTRETRKPMTSREWREFNRS